MKREPSLDSQITLAEREYVAAANRYGALLQRKGGPHNWAGRPSLASLACLNGGGIAITEEAFKVLSELRSLHRRQDSLTPVVGGVVGQHDVNQRLVDLLHNLVAVKLQEVDK